jgi:hypothetical protein
MSIRGVVGMEMVAHGDTADDQTRIRGARVHGHPLHLHPPLDLFRRQPSRCRL